MKPCDYITENVCHAVDAVDDVTVNEFVESLLNAKTVFIYGVGRSGLVGRMFAARLAQLEFNVHFAAEITTPVFGDGDVGIFISNTGETMSVVNTAKTAKKLRCKTVCITGNANGGLARASDLPIVLKHYGDEDSKYAPLGTMFECCTGVFFDSMVPVLMERKGISEDRMRKNHAVWL